MTRGLVANPMGLLLILCGTWMLGPSSGWSQTNPSAKARHLKSAPLANGDLPLGLVLGQPLPKGLPVTLDGDHLAHVNTQEMLLDGFQIHRLDVSLEAGKVYQVMLSLFGKGDTVATQFRKVGDALCGDEGLGRMKHGRPGPGTPKKDPLTGQIIPLVRRSKARCQRTWGTRTMSVSLTRSRDGESLDKNELIVHWDDDPP